MNKIVTYQDARGGKIDVCEKCTQRYEAAGSPWPVNRYGEEYCTVSHGLHTGACEFCED